MADNIEVGDLVARISFDDTGLNKSMAEIDRQMKLVKSELDKASSALQGYGSEEEKLKAKSDLLNQQLQLQQQRVSKLNEEFQRSVREKGLDSKETQALAVKLNQAQTAYNKIDTELKQVNDDLAAQRASLTDTRTAWEKLDEGIRGAGEKLKTVGKQMTDAGKNLSMKVTAPVAAAGAGILKVGLDFEAAMSKVQAISGSTGDELETLKQQAKDLGATTMFSASQATSGMEFLARAGWKSAEIIEAMPGLLDLAASGAMDLGRAADITSNVMSAFGISANEAGHVADVFAKASSNANTDVEQLGLAMTYLAPVANTLGWSLEEATAAVMSMSDAGIQGEKAGAAFSTSLQRLANPTKEMTKVMKDLGISFFDSGGNIKPMPQLVSDLERATANLTNEQKAAALSTIFGAEAYKNWAVLVEAGSATLGKNTEMLVAADGAAQAMAKVMQENGKGAVTEMNSALEGLGIQLSEHIIPIFTSVVQNITEAIRWFGTLDDSLQKVILIVAGVVAAIGPLLMVAGSLVTTIGALAPVFAALASPIGIAVAAIAAITAALVVLYKKNEDFKNFVDKTWEQIKKSIVAAAKAISEFVKPIITEVVNFISEQLKKMRSFWDENGAAIMDVVKVAFGQVVETIKMSIGIIKGLFEVAWPIISGVVKIAWESIKLTISSVLDIIMGVIKVALKLLKGDWSGAWEALKETVVKVMDNTLQFLRNINLVQIGKDIVQGLINGLSSMVGALKERIKSLANTVTEGIKGVLGINSPSKVTEQLGEWTGEGFAVGLQSSMREIEQQTKAFASAVPGAYGTNGQQNASNQTLNFGRMFEGASFVVQKEQDIPRIAEAVSSVIMGKMQSSFRGMGG